MLGDVLAQLVLQFLAGPLLRIAWAVLAGIGWVARSIVSSGRQFLVWSVQRKTIQRSAQYM